MWRERERERLPWVFFNKRKNLRVVMVVLSKEC